MGSVWANRAQCWLKLGDHEKVLGGGEGWNWNYLDESWMIDEIDDIKDIVLCMHPVASYTAECLVERMG